MTALLLCGCGKDDEPAPTKPAQKQSSGNSGVQAPSGSPAPAQPSASAGAAGGSVSSPADMAQMAEQNRQRLAKMNDGQVVAAVAADKLKAVLPASLTGMTKGEASAERTQMMGIDMTTAKVQFEAAGGGNITVTITDVGSMTGPMRMGLTGWAMAEYSRQTDDGYERTMAYKGYRGMEEYDKQGQSGTVRLFVADRFIVEVKGSDVTADALKQALGAIDLTQLAGLASAS